MMDLKNNNAVFNISLIITFIIVITGIVVPEKFGGIINGLYNGIVNNFSWMYVMSMFIFFVFCIYLAFSKYGNIKLGDDDSKPELSNFSWFSMLFGAGMGIGLVFWGVAEPLNHYLLPPPGIIPGSDNAINNAFKSSYLHWGLNPWACYSLVGLTLAYFQFRKKKPGLISNVFIPLLGEEKVNGWIGKYIDILAVFATVAGISTSLGLGTLQINGGLNFLFGVPSTTLVQVCIIIVITIIYIWTAVTGIERGIKKLSDINLTVALIMLILSSMVGPTLKMINAFLNSFGLYISNFLVDGFHIEPFGDNRWVSNWTVFYWAWWIAWAPFVGTFIARISKGRTIREFIFGVTIVPSIVSFIWFSTYGVLGINLGEEIASQAIQVTEMAFFVVMQNYPLGYIISLIAMLLVCIFFITSANSATFVLGMMTSNGDLNPSNSKKIVWGLVQSLLSIVLLLSGGLTALQTCSIAAAFPFGIIMVAMCFSLYKSLKQEKIIQLRLIEKENSFN